MANISHTTPYPNTADGQLSRAWGWVAGAIIVLLFGLVAWATYRDRTGTTTTGTTPLPQTPAAVTTSTLGTVTTTPITVVTPKDHDMITSPLVVQGEALGTWFFEASFPVRILDANGRELGVTPVQAQSDWMTTSSVPFVGTILFSEPTTETGWVVFQRDNPSGLPEYEEDYRIPVRFATFLNIK